MMGYLNVVKRNDIAHVAMRGIFVVLCVLHEYVFALRCSDSVLVCALDEVCVVLLFSS